MLFWDIVKHSPQIYSIARKGVLDIFISDSEVTTFQVINTNQDSPTLKIKLKKCYSGQISSLSIEARVKFKLMQPPWEFHENLSVVIPPSS